MSNFQRKNNTISSEIDLHCHTTCSDGHFAPEELIERAAERGVKTLAITDHDTLEGYRQGQAAAEKHDIQLISGIEVSCVWRGITLHVVGLNVDADNPQMQQAEAEQSQVRFKRAETIARKVGKVMQRDIDLSAIEEIAGGEIGRPHFAEYLLQQGWVKTRQEAFKKYLGAGKPGDVKSCWPELETVVKWIVEAGGVAILAHPHHYKMTRTKLIDCLSEFKHHGGQAMEVCCGMMDKSDQNRLAGIAKELALYGSRGSDYHGPNRFGLDLGVMPSFPKDIDNVLDLIQLTA